MRQIKQIPNEVHSALKVFIDIEKMGHDSMDEYRSACEKRKPEIDKANYTLRAHGQSICDGRLDEAAGLQSEFYKIVRDEKYSSDPMLISVVSASLNDAWRGLADWQA